jgi:hypothetical protein
MASTHNNATPNETSGFHSNVKNMIRNLPNDCRNDDEAKQTISAIAFLICHDYDYVKFTIEVIQTRICNDSTWATSAALDVYELLAENFPYEIRVRTTDDANLPMKGALLLRQVMRSSCQKRFQHTMTETSWNSGFIYFLGQICNPIKITSLACPTPEIILDIMADMAESDYLADNGNFDLFIDFVMQVVPFVDLNKQLEERVTHEMEQARRRARDFGLSFELAVYGLFWWREQGWQTETEYGVSRSERKVLEAAEARKDSAAESLDGGFSSEDPDFSSENEGSSSE